MSIFDITLAGAYVQATDAAARSDRREALRWVAKVPGQRRSNSLVSIVALFRRVIALTFKTPEGVRLAPETESCVD